MIANQNSYMFSTQWVSFSPTKEAIIAFKFLFALSLSHARRKYRETSCCLSLKGPLLHPEKVQVRWLAQFSQGSSQKAESLAGVSWRRSSIRHLGKHFISKEAQFGSGDWYFDVSLCLHLPVHRVSLTWRWSQVIHFGSYTWLEVPKSLPRLVP